MLQEPTDLVAVVPVAITNGEEVTVAQLEYVRVRQVSVLVLLVRVVHGYAAFSGKAELGHNIVDSTCRFGLFGRFTLVIGTGAGSGLNALRRLNSRHRSSLHALDGKCLYDKVLRLITVHVHPVLRALDFQRSREKLFIDHRWILRVLGHLTSDPI